MEAGLAGHVLEFGGIGGIIGTKGGHGGVNWDYAAGILLIAVVGCQIALWAKFRGDDPGRRVGISTLQFLVVVAAVTFLRWFPNATLEVLLAALTGIVALSFLPVKKTTP